MAAPPIVMTPTPFANGARARVQASTMLLQEWLNAKYAGAQVFPELRLGPTVGSAPGVPLPPAVEGMLRVSNWKADAVVVLPTEVLVVEAKVKPNSGAVGQALFYRTLIYSTPALAAYTTLSVQPVVLFAYDDSGITAFARGLGCRVEIYTPTWIVSYLEGELSRYRSAPSSGTP